jgi:arabinan endo-1,5-alpha-L-arabinosidase
MRCLRLTLAARWILCVAWFWFGATLLLPISIGIAQAPHPDPDAGSIEAERLERLGSRALRVHDPSTLIACKGDYWIFHTGRGISSARSRDLLSWQPGPPVFAEAPSWVAETVPENRRMHFWAPDIIHQNDRFFLYYSVSTFGKNTSAIALATNPTLDPDDLAFAWTDEGIVIQSGPRVDYNAIDPALFQDVDGRLWMSFGSFWSGIKLVELDPHSGKRAASDSTIHALAHHDTIEAPFIYLHDEHYYLFVNWGFCCRGTNSTYEIRVGRSDQVTGPYVDKEGVDMLLGGGLMFLETDGAMIGPGHAGILREGHHFWFSFHFYDGTQRGVPTYAIRPLRWTQDGWPEIANPTSD